MKKLSKKIFTVAMAGVLTLTSLAVAGCNNNDGGMDSTYEIAKTWDPVELHTYYLSGLGEGVMPVGGFGGPYTPSGNNYNGHIQPDFNEDIYWQYLKDCGVNNIVFAWNEYRMDTDAIMKALDQAVKYDMVYFVRDNFMGHFYNGNKKLEDVISEYIYHPGCGGVYGRDEPGGNTFETYGRLIQTMYSDERFEGKDVYMNMLPCYASTSAFGKWGSYENYIRGYMEECAGIPYLCYDYYPFTVSEHNLDSMNGSPGRYFYNLGFIRNVAMENKVPFWAYYCVGEVGETDFPYYPSKELYFWNMNTILAYGAKGLQLYSVIQSPVDYDITDAAGDKEEGKNYERFALIGGMGNTTRWYYYQKEFATHLAVIDEYLMNAQNMGVFAVGDRAVYLGEGAEVIQEKTFRELKGVDAEEAIIGCFDHEGATMLYVVNNDENKQKIQLQFDNKYGYDVYQRGTLASVACKNLTLTMEGGEGVLVKLRTA